MPQHVARYPRVLLRVVWLVLAGSGVAGATPPAPDPTESFAVVNDTVITVGEYAEALRDAARHTFYHAHPPEGELAAFQQRVAQAIIDRVLLVEEAQRRGLAPDHAAVQEALGRAAARGADPELLPALRQRLEEDSLIGRLDVEARAVPAPAEAELRDYYQQHPELFTEPGQIRLSVMLLRVDPSAGAAAWQAAGEEAEAILRRLRGGADFAELARLHSADVSAAQGGDMGYLHEGMLAPEIERAALGLDPGELAGPVMVLEGIAVLRLDGRRPAQLQSFEAVAGRAAALLQREQENAAAVALRDELRASASIELREELLMPGGATDHGQPPD